MASEAQPTEPTTSSNPSTTNTTTSTPTSILSSFHAYPFTNDKAFLGGLSSIFGHPGKPVTEAELAQKPDLLLSAKCFYFNRKFQAAIPVEPAKYKAWIASQPQQGLGSVDTPQQSAEAVLPSSTSTFIPTTTTTSLTASTAASTTGIAGTDATSVSNVSASAPAEPSATTESTSSSQPQSQSQSQTQSQPPPPPYPTSFAAIVDLITNNKPIPGIEEIPTTVLEHGSSKQDRATRRRKPWEKDAEADTNVDSSSVTASATDTALSKAPDTTAAVQSEDQSRDDSMFDSLNMKKGRDQNAGEGLLRLLRPDAVPDSGLIAKE